MDKWGDVVQREFFVVSFVKNSENGKLIYSNQKDKTGYLDPVAGMRERG